MKRNPGLTAGVLAVLALVGISTLPIRSPENPAAPETKGNPVAPRGTAPKNETRRPSDACLEIAARVNRLVDPSGTPAESWNLPESCYGSGAAAKTQAVKARGVRFVIATLPNPVSTHLPLLFDRLVESIQSAVQDDGYLYDASWFPWDTAAKNYALLADEQAADELRKIQEAQPGVMVFRQALTGNDGKPRPAYGGGLVIFMVGEQPTGGLSDEQFGNALDWIAKLGGDSRNLLILGPTFSGSLPSLARALDRNPAAKQATLFISSGTVSSPGGYKWFRDWMDARRNGSHFRTAMESDSLMVERFCRFLEVQGYEVPHVAFVSEDETSFGASRDDSACRSAMQLYYPRDIAMLRSAYERQSILNPTKPDANSSTRSTTLRGDLSEPSSNEHDTVRYYGGQLTPLAQESILLDIVKRLSEKRIQFVILRSTSSLDQVFLAQFLRRSYSQARIVIDGADLLFNRGAEGKSLRGVMLLSTYPLFTAEQDWTASPSSRPPTSYRTFSEDTAEGIYIAARELLCAPVLGGAVPIPDYRPPAWARGPNQKENQLPVTWLSVISRRQFWPLAALNSYTLQRRTQSTILEPLSCVSAAGTPCVQPEKGPIPLTDATWMVVSACILWSIIHWYFCSNASIMGAPRARAYFAPMPRWQHPVIVGLGSLILAMLAVAFAAGSGLFSWVAGAHPFHERLTGPLLTVALLLIVLFAIFGWNRNYALRQVRAANSCVLDTKRWHRIPVWTGVVGLFVFALIQLYLASKLTPANRIPVYWRSVTLTSGVSGLLPEMLLLAGAYLWFWFNLRGLAHFGEDRPVLPKSEDLPKCEDGTPLMPMFSAERAGMPVEKAALPLARIKQLVPLFVVTFLAAGVVLDGFAIRTLGELQFGTLILVWICLYIAVILTDGIQTWLAWNELRRLLVFFNRLPLRRTLGALKGLAWGSIWTMSGNVLEERYRVVSLQMESLRHLRNTRAAWLSANGQNVDSDELLRKIDERANKSTAFAKWFAGLSRGQRVDDITHLRDFQMDVASIAGMVMNRVLIPEWHTETVSLIFTRSNPDEKPKDGERPEIVIPTDDLKPHLRAAEEFFVLPYLAFIQNILGRIRTMALGTLWLFLGATLAVSSYPFEPLSILGAIFLVVFLLVGGVTILVYSQMARDATLSHITNTRPGELGGEFWLRLVGFGIGPLLGLLTTLFPSITDFAFSWLQPSLQSLK